jgi:poly[(R)-3-hydroxyalkanoate] polymerase subunit PhaC
LRPAVGPAVQAVDSPVTLSPIVGVSGDDVLKGVNALLSAAVREPSRFMKHVGTAGREVVDVVAGRSTVEVPQKDRRFADPAWQSNPVQKRLAQGWLALGNAARGYVDGLELDALARTRVNLFVSLVVDALAPSNLLLTNPSAMKRAVDTGGLSLVRGLQNLARDLRENGGMPALVDKRPFKVGENVACTPGAVVHRSETLELIQYQPQTERVHAIPLLFVPPQINKYYVLDLAPQKSLVRFLVSQGFQVFVVSWRNPGPEQRDWGMGHYVQSLMEASDVVRSITGSKRINISGGCSGGITTAMLLSHLAALRDRRINSVTFWVCVLDPVATDSDVGALVTPQSIKIARRRSARTGILPGATLARVFAWLRPNDLVWNYVVNNYLHGETPPAFDVLFWNADSTNLTAALHSDYLDLYLTRPFANPGDVKLLDRPIDLRRVDIDSYILGGTTDHITPWKACYRVTSMLGGKREFVLSNSGHIQAIVNPPGNPRARYFTSSALPATAEEWLAGARENEGSWWEHWSAWLRARSGAQVAAPRRLGSRTYRVLTPAPGEYVRG